MKMLFGVMAALVGGLIPAAAIAQAPPPDPIPYYVGIGARFGLNDATSFMINSKAQVADLGSLTLSVRPSLLLGNETEFRLPLSLEGAIDRGLYPYGGAGIAYNADGENSIDPMLSVGLDLGITSNLVIDLGSNLIFKDTDTDLEFAATINYAF